MVFRVSVGERAFLTIAADASRPSCATHRRDDRHRKGAASSHALVCHDVDARARRVLAIQGIALHKGALFRIRGYRGGLGALALHVGV